jgi:hypothetical protein
MSPSGIPPSPPPVAVLPFPTRPDDALRLALRHLDEALRDQARVLAAWREEMGRLGGAIGGLKDSVCAYRAALDDTAAAAGHAHAAARRPGATAEVMRQRAAATGP